MHFIDMYIWILTALFELLIIWQSGRVVWGVDLRERESGSEKGAWVQIPFGELTKLVSPSNKLVFTYKPWFWYTNFPFESTDCLKSIVLKFHNCLQWFGIHIWNFGSMVQNFQTTEPLHLLGCLTKYSNNIPKSRMDAHVEPKIPHWPLKSSENSTISTIVYQVKAEA